MRCMVIVIALVLITSACGCNKTDEKDTVNTESTIEEADWNLIEGFMELYEEGSYIEDGLILGKYDLIGFIVRSGYEISDDYEPERTDGFNTGQWIDVYVVEEIPEEGYDPRNYTTIEGIFSYGGDTVIPGKCHAGDLVGHRYGNYVSIWEKIDLAKTEDLIDTSSSETAVVDVRITKIYYDGQVYRTEADEYVEIKNFGTASVNLKGWRLVDIDEGYPSFTFPDYELLPGETVRVYTNEYHPEYGGFSFKSGKAVWNNSDPDNAVLYDSQGQKVSKKSY